MAVKNQSESVHSYLGVKPNTIREGDSSSVKSEIDTYSLKNEEITSNNSSQLSRQDVSFKKTEQTFGLNQTLDSSMHNLVLSEQDTQGVEISKLLGLYRQGFHESSSSESNASSKPGQSAKKTKEKKGNKNKAEKKIVSKMMSGFKSIQSQFGSAAKKLCGKKIDLSFFFRRLQWLSFYYESVRRERMLELLRKEKQQYNNSKVLQFYLDEAILVSVINEANQQIQDLKESSIQRNDSMFSQYQVGSMVTGVYISCMVAVMADKGIITSRDQEAKLRQYFKCIHETQFVEQDNMELQVMVPPVELNRDHLQMMQMILKPEKGEQLIQREIELMQLKDIGAQELFASMTTQLKEGMMTSDKSLVENALAASRAVAVSTGASMQTSQDMNDMRSDLIEELNRGGITPDMLS